MKKTKTPAPQRAVREITKAVRLALRIERIRKTDPKHYLRIMRKLTELERGRRILERRSIS